MKDNKVDVIISQERHEELLKKEKALVKLKKSKTVLIGFKYLDLRHYKRTLMQGDDIDLIYDVGDGIPQDLKDYVNISMEEMKSDLSVLNDYRLKKIDAAKEELKQDIKWRQEGNLSPVSWDILEWLGIKEWFKKDK